MLPRREEGLQNCIKTKLTPETSVSLLHNNSFLCWLLSYLPSGAVYFLFCYFYLRGQTNWRIGLYIGDTDDTRLYFRRFFFDYFYI